MNRTLAYASTPTRDILLSAWRPAISHACSRSLHPRRIPGHVVPPIRSISTKKKMQSTDHLPLLEGQSKAPIIPPWLSRDELDRIVQIQNKQWQVYHSQERRSGKTPKLKNMASDLERRAKQSPFPVKRELGPPQNTRFIPPQSGNRPLDQSRTTPSSYLLTGEADRPLDHVEADKIGREGNVTAEKVFETSKPESWSGC
jgi:hypothetical protein